MMTILDSNVLSESTKPAPAPPVIRWLAARDPVTTYTTAITQAEMLWGLERLRPGKRRTDLTRSVEKILGEFSGGRILPFDEDAAAAYAKITWARTAVGRPISQLDAMIAAITRSRGAVLATRDADGFDYCGIRVVNPWGAPAG